MRTMVDLAHLVVASWFVATKTNQIPSAEGVFDAALRSAAENPSFPTWGRQMLHFVESRFGLQCLEAEAILQAAGMARLTSDPNPSYVRTDVVTSPRVARWLLSRAGVTMEDAERIGIALQSGAEAVTSRTSVLADG